MSILGKLLGRPDEVPAKPPSPSGPLPDQPLFIVGDLHGRLDLFEKMLERVDGAIGIVKLRNPLLVFVGDIVDRGPDSAGVVRRMMELTAEFPQNVVCIRGNHEQMLLDFLDAPAVRYSRWMRNGGVETCKSFGLSVQGENEDPQVVGDALREAMGPEMIDWLRQRPTSHTCGNVACVHAAADPARSIDSQSDRVLIWGHPEFLTSIRKDGQWVAHGHTVFDVPMITDNRISVDTGAYMSGILSCAVLLPNGEADFLQVRLTS
ncbi:MAG: metallophosphoesterase family protein [Litoreibacter sp.]